MKFIIDARVDRGIPSLVRKRQPRWEVKVCRGAKSSGTQVGINVKVNVLVILHGCFWYTNEEKSSGALNVSI